MPYKKSIKLLTALCLIPSTVLAFSIKRSALSEEELSKAGASATIGWYAFDQVESATKTIAGSSKPSSSISFDELFLLTRLFAGQNETGAGLGQVLLINQVFNQGKPIFQDKLTLGDLIILDRLFKEGAYLSNNETGTTLGDLLILDAIFND